MSQWSFSILPPWRQSEQAGETYGKPPYAYLLGSYYLSFLFIPWTGSRNFCRWGCPWGGIWGIIGYFGFYRLKADPELCTGCGICEKVCDMGIPVVQYIRKKGGFVHTPECMGCGRCITACPEGALKIIDVRDWRQCRRSRASDRQRETINGPAKGNTCPRGVSPS